MKQKISDLRKQADEKESQQNAVINELRTEVEGLRNKQEGNEVNHNNNEEGERRLKELENVIEGLKTHIAEQEEVIAGLKQAKIAETEA